MERRLTVPGRFDRLETIAKFVEQAGQAAGLDEVAICRCQLAVDEAVTNIIEHGYGGEGRGDIDLSCLGEPEQGQLTITISDQAKPFNPASIPEPTLNVPLEDMQIGGLGLYFMRQVMDAVEFKHTADGNQLVLVKRRETGAAAETLEE
ncbi:MAG: ATP-binding protein [Anaerolineales bacterium]|nr:ATP-binding protein [Anaerolineales bacterium]